MTLLTLAALLLPTQLPPARGTAPTWTAAEAATLVQSNAAKSTLRRGQVAVHGDTAVLGSTVGNTPTVTYVFERDQGGPDAWGEAAQLSPGTLTPISFGSAVAIHGDIIVVGAPWDDLGVMAHGDVEGLAHDPLAGCVWATDVDGDELLCIDPATGNSVPIGPLGFGQVVGLAFDPTSGTLYGSDRMVDQLLTIDTSTGAGTAVGALGFGDVRGLAFDPGTGTLYGADKSSGQLLTIDTSTGAGTAIGPLGWANVQGLTFDPGSGRLYASDIQTNELVSVDPSNASGTAVGPLGFSRVRGLAFDVGQSELYGVTIPSNSCPEAQCVVQFLDVDTVSGAATAVGLVYVGGTETGAVYVFERDLGGPGAWGLAKKLWASDAAPYDDFGRELAFDGDRLVVGSPGSSGFRTWPGSATIFERDQGGADEWGEVVVLSPSDGNGYDTFGDYVDLYGDTVVVGASNTAANITPDGVYFFERDQGGSGAWGEVIKLTMPGPYPSGFSGPFSLWEDELLLRFGGVVEVRQRNAPSGAWGKIGALTPDDLEPGDVFGNDLDVFGELAVIASSFDVHAPGAPGHFQNGEGSAYVFRRDAGTASGWREAVKLTASVAEQGQLFGRGVRGSGQTVIGSAKYGPPVPSAGEAYVFELGHQTGSYCTAGTSASGCQALLTSSGSASATASSGFDLLASTVEGQRDGLFFFGTNGRQANSWGSGTSYQCVVPPVVRAGLLAGSGTVGSCDGSMVQDLNALWCPTCPKPAKNPGTGALVQAQLWYRDPQNTSNQTTSLSDAIEFLVLP